ncbi:MAG: hypothetical protein IKQ35_04870 [Bacilli bacterium]|nr:hypothetical protein [Bacilli bacterium]
MERRKEFDMYIKELNKIYETNPDRAIKEAYNSLERLNHGVVKSYKSSNINSNTLKGTLGDINIDILMVIVLAIVGFVSGLGAPGETAFGMWIGGYIFFIAGHFIGMFVPVFGLIFLFSHSITGLCLMNGAVLSSVLSNPIMQDNPRNIFVYISFVIGLYIIATLIVILHNLSNNLKSKKHIILVPLSIYTLGFILINILPHIMNQLYNFHLFG